MARTTDLPKDDHSPILVQHNALVNAHFKMSSIEMRLFVALLRRIGKDDEVLATHLIPIKELGQGTTNALYKEVALMLQSMMKKFIQVEEIGPNGERDKYPILLGRPLMGVADYLPGEGMIRAAFNVHMKPYMVALGKCFTSTNIESLEKLRAPASHRIYWLLQEFRSLKRTQRVISVPDLRDLLGLTDEYVGRFDNFKLRVLDVAQKELAGTDLPFTYTVNLNNKRVSSEVVFSFAVEPAKTEAAPGTAAAPLLLLESLVATANTAPGEWVEGSWQALMLAAGVSNHSIAAIQSGLDAKKYPEQYIRYVDGFVRKEHFAGKIKSISGAVYAGIVNAYYLNEFRAHLATEAKKVTAKIPAGDKAKRLKLQSQLDDLEISLAFQNQIVIGTLHPTEDARQVFVGNIRAQMAAIEALLH